MINPGKYYTPQELEDMGKEGFFPIKEKITILARIESGELPAFNRGRKDGRKSWMIKGSDILAFLDLRGTYSLQEREKWKNDEESKTTKTRKKKED